MQEKNISQVVISRLPRYFRYLGDLKDEGMERISSGELSKRMNVTASQIRQDFNHFGGFGQQGYGYNVNYLYEEIGKIRGLDKRHYLIIIGVGMLNSMRQVNYSDYTEAFPAFLCIAFTLFGNNIANGICVAIPVYLLLKLISGKVKEINAVLIIVTAVCGLYFYTLVR